MILQIEQLDKLVRCVEAMDSRLQRIEAMLAQTRPTESGRKVMNVDEVAAFTGYAKKYIYHLTGTHRIPHYKRDGKVVFMKDEIAKWLRETKVKTENELLM